MHSARGYSDVAVDEAVAEMFVFVVAPVPTRMGFESIAVGDELRANLNGMRTGVVELDRLWPRHNRLLVDAVAAAVAAVTGTGNRGWGPHLYSERVYLLKTKINRFGYDV